MNTTTINSLPTTTAFLREMMTLPEAELREFAENHQPYDRSSNRKICVEHIWCSLSAETPLEPLQRFAATVLKSRQDPAFGEIELINTGE